MLQYKNLKINFIKISSRKGRIGTSIVEINSSLAHSFYATYKESQQIFDLDVYISLKREDNFRSKNPDLQVMLYKYMLDQEEQFEITVYGEDEFWIWHDVAHSQKDVMDFNVHIFAENEEERLRETVELNGGISEQLKQEIETEYFNTFNKKICL